MIIKFINTIAADKSTKDVCAEKKASIFVLFEFQRNFRHMMS